MITCYYHRNCWDGTAAAMCVALARREPIKFIAMDYQKPLPISIPGNEVYMVDFSTDLEQLRLLLDPQHGNAPRITIIDHHSRPISDLCRSIAYAPDLPGGFMKRVNIVYDNLVCGAELTWRTLNPGATQVPRLLRHIGDVDLYTHQDPDSQYVTRALTRYGFDPIVWVQHVWPQYGADLGFDELIDQGRALVADDDIKIQWHLENCRRTIKLADQCVPLIGVPRYLMSATMDRVLQEGHPFAVGYYDLTEGRRLRLNSRRDSGVDVSVIAQSLGGNGHSTSAGVLLPWGHPLTRI